MFTIDASVWVDAHSPNEAGQRDSLALINMLRADGTVVVEPTLLPVEIAGVISRTRRDERLASDMAVALLALPTIRWVSLDVLVARQAADLAAQHRLRGADAVYAAVALAHGCDLISLDQEHLTRLRTVVNTVTPVQALAMLKGGSQPS